MNLDIVSLRPFIGSKDFEVSKSFYKDLGFTESPISEEMSRFYRDQFSFYLQDAFVEDWNHNTMLFIEIKDVDECHNEITKLGFDKKYGVKVTPIKKDSWGRECFLLDPSGVLLHFGQFG
ncbi:MAG TPA: glyoxalase [Sphingobacteriaceae bacterium]|nr:glyoxalase [Sphingobacteriaceae bacterium]